MTPNERKRIVGSLQQGLDRHIPLHMHDGLMCYILDGVPPGDFLTAVLENNLLESYVRADFTNAKIIPEYVQFLYCFAPTGCWKSPAAVKRWIAHRGLSGIDDDKEDIIE